MAKLIFWLGPSLEQWNFATALEQGIGGSETAAIHLAREFAKLGHEIVVYANLDSVFKYSVKVRIVDGERVDEGGVLRAIPYQGMPEHEPCDIFVSSRQPEARRKCLPHCKTSWLWVHDLHCGPDWDNLIATDYDNILCLSSFAREKFLVYYPGLDPAKVLLTSNAVDFSLFDQSIFTDPDVLGCHPMLLDRLRPGEQQAAYRDGISPLRVTYSSSPDRGLEKLLDLWPRICELAPLAPPPELHVYYGFENWRKSAKLHGSAADVVRADWLTYRLSTTPGVFNHGRAGQAEVARSFLRSQLWLYPTDFLETSCITAMEAQAAGCRIVATRCGALPETVPGARFVEGPTSAPDYDDRFLRVVEKTLQERADYVPAHVRTWSDVAKQWDEWIREIGLGG